MQRTHSGFSLLELMIVVMIIGILAAIAFPSYRSYGLRSNRTVAKTVLMKIAGQEESYFTDRKSYTVLLTQLGTEYGANSVFLKRDGTTVSASTSDSIYQVTLTNPAPANLLYQITATPVNQQLTGEQSTPSQNCGTLTLDNTGAKTPAGDCWTR